MNNEKVYLKGYVVGHSADTLGYHGLMVQLENLDIVEVDKSLVYKIVDEPQKPVVPQSVVDWYEEHKDDLEISIFHYVNNINKEDESAFKRWFVDSTTKPFQILVNMHQFGYEVEKEKRYRIKLKSNPEEVDYLVDTKTNGFRFYSNIYTQKREHTRKEIEAAGFGWVFDCPGIEVEEVEG